MWRPSCGSPTSPTSCCSSDAIRPPISRISSIPRPSFISVTARCKYALVGRVQRALGRRCRRSCSTWNSATPAVSVFFRLVLSQSRAAIEIIDIFFEETDLADRRPDAAADARRRRRARLPDQRGPCAPIGGLTLGAATPAPASGKIARLVLPASVDSPEFSFVTRSICWRWPRSRRNGCPRVRR